MTGALTFPPVGKCIYCGSNGDGMLSDEHIVPFSLGGISVLPKASCASCAKITSAFEGRCARKMYGNFRIRHKVPTRRPKKRPKAIATIAIYGDSKKHILMPVDGAIVLFPKIKFRTPGVLRSPPEKNKSWDGAEYTIQMFQPIDKASWKEYAAEKYEFQQAFDFDSLALTLAKIAHSLSIANLGTEFFDPWLPEYILGYNKDLAYLVGGADYPEDSIDKLHDISWHVGPHTDSYMVTQFLVTVRIKLFSQITGAHALVVVGATTRDAVEKRIAEIPENPFVGDVTYTICT